MCKDLQSISKNILYFNRGEISLLPKGFACTSFKENMVFIVVDIDLIVFAGFAITVIKILFKENPGWIPLAVFEKIIESKLIYEN